MSIINQFTYKRAFFDYAFLNCLRFQRIFAHHVQIPNSADFNHGTNDFCYSIWVNSQSDTGAIFTKGMTFQLLFAQDNVYATDKWPVCKIRQFNSNNTTYNLYAGTQGVALAKNTWHHIIVQRKGGNDAGNRLLANYQLFWNGTLQTAKSISGAGGGEFVTSIIDSVQPFTMGYSPEIPGEGPYLNGYEDEFFVLKGTWLTEAEAAEVYNAGLGAPPPERTWPNLQAYWFYNEKNGFILEDHHVTYRETLATLYHGQLKNYTAAQVAAAGNPQAGQVAWCDHTTLNPITV